MIPFEPQGCRHWWAEPASWPHCGQWWLSGPSSRQSFPQKCPRQTQQHISPSDTQQHLSFIYKTWPNLALRFSIDEGGQSTLFVFAKTDWKMFVITASQRWGNPALIGSQIMTTKLTALTWTVSVRLSDLKSRCFPGGVSVNGNLTENYQHIVRCCTWKIDDGRSCQHS